MNKFLYYKKRIFAEGENFTLEERMLLSVVIIGTITSFLGAFINFILITSFLAMLVPLLLTIMLLIVYYFFRFKKVFRPFIMPVSLLSYIGISIIWISNGGADGSNIMPAIVILILSLIAAPTWKKPILVLAFTSIFIINFSIQYFYPNAITYFNTEKEKWLDAIITLSYSVMFIYFIIKYLINQYNLEKFKVELSEKKLLELNDELIRLNHSKDKFFSIIAHDLRTPLSAFGDMLDMMNDSNEELNEQERKDFLSIMQKSAGNLNNLLNNLLEWSQIQQGVMDFQIQSIDLTSIIKNAEEFYRINAVNKSITIFNHINKEAFINADAHMISTIFRNLINNAIKFTEKEGQIDIDMRIEEDFYLFVVKDNGCGMDQNLMSNLFKIDIKTTTLGTQGEKGTGLGLLLCQEFVEKHGGKIWVESEVGKGSTFYFTIKK